MRYLVRAVMLCGVLALPVRHANSQISGVGSGAFSGATVIDFNTIGDAALISNQFAGSGVTFSGSLYGMTNSGDVALFPSGATVIASNWIYGAGGLQGLLFSASFSSPQNILGFWLENWGNQLLTVELFSGAASLGSFAFGPTVGLTAEFWGLSSVASFDGAVFINTDDTNGFFALDDFQFGTAESTVPEPATMTLMAMGLGAIGAARRRRAAKG